MPDLLSLILVDCPGVIQIIPNEIQDAQGLFGQYQGQTK